MERMKTGRKTILNQGVKRLVTGLLSVALLIALTMIVSSDASAQIECLGVCEQQLVECIRNSDNNPQFGPNCLTQYEACVDACLGDFAALFE